MKRNTMIILIASITLITWLVYANGNFHKHSSYKIEYIKIINSLLAYQESSIKNAGSIQGKVIFNGNKIPTNKKKLITKDKEVCGEGYKVDEVYKINSKKEVEDVVVYLEDIASGKPIKKEEIVLEQIKCEFKPRILAIPVGSKLTIINKDTVTHEANGIFNFATIFQLAQPKQGMKDTIELKQPGIVSITCNIHGWMKAFAFVVDNPYYAISDKNGNFKISDIPPGTYKLKLWHEKLKPQNEEISISIKPNETEKLTIELSE